MSLIQCTLANNQATNTSSTDGGGAVDNTAPPVVGDPVPAEIVLDGCILAGNTAASGSGPDLWMESGTHTATYCLVGDGTGSTLTDGVNSNLVGTSASPIDALLAPLGNYGGPTLTMPPLFGSPAIDRGDHPASSSTDQRGFYRPVGLAADIGAVEVQVAASASLVTLNNTIWHDKSGIGDRNYFRFTFTNLPNSDFTVQTTTNLALPSGGWMPVGEAVESPAGSGNYFFYDQQVNDVPQRFYRVILPLSPL